MVYLLRQKWILSLIYLANIFNPTWCLILGNYLISLNIFTCLIFLLLHLKRPQFISSDVLKISAILNIRLFIFAATIALIGELIYTSQTYYLSDSANEHGYKAFLDNDRLFGKYWYGYWGYSLFDLLSMLLFLIKPIRQNYFLSLLVMILSQTVFMLQRFIIMVTSSHWDYIPTSWTLYVDWKELILFSIIPSVLLSFLLIFFNVRKYQITKE